MERAVVRRPPRRRLLGRCSRRWRDWVGPRAVGVARRRRRGRAPSAGWSPAPRARLTARRRPRRGSPPGCSRAGSSANVVIGRMPFTLGVACAVGGVGVRGALHGRPAARAWPLGAPAVPRAGGRARRSRPRARQWGPARVLMGSWASGLSGRGGAAAVGCRSPRRAPSAVTGSRARVGVGDRRPGCWRSRPRGRARWPACSCARPRPGPLLAGGRAGRAARGSARRHRPSRPGSRSPIAFPEGGPDRFVATAFWPMLALCVRRDAAARRRARPLCARARSVYLALLVAAFVDPDAARAERAAARACCSGRRCSCSTPRPRAPRGLLIAGDRAARLPAVAAGRARGRPRRPATRRPRPPSTQAAAARLDAAGPAGRARRGAAHPQPLGGRLRGAEHVPLARGWQRQLDREANALFYGDRPLNAARYLAWLRANAVRWVALPDAPLDLSAEARGAAAARRRARTCGCVWRVAALDGLGGPRTARPRRRRRRA